MIPVLFIGIAIMFLCLAIASYKLKESTKKPHGEIIKILEREIAREKDEKIAQLGYASATSYLYKTTNNHFRLEFLGFIVAAIAAIIESLAYGWR
jgi:hypothetical protein